MFSNPTDKSDATDANGQQLGEDKDRQDAMVVEERIARVEGIVGVSIEKVIGDFLERTLGAHEDPKWEMVVKERNAGSLDSRAPKTRFEKSIFVLQANLDMYCHRAVDNDAFAK